MIEMTADELHHLANTMTLVDATRIFDLKVRQEEGILDAAFESITVLWSTGRRTIVQAVR